MEKNLHQEFNENSFSQKNHDAIIESLEKKYGTIGFRVSETPLFLTEETTKQIVSASIDIINQLSTDEYRAISAHTIPADFTPHGKALHSQEHWCIDFALTEDQNGKLKPMLIEAQAGSSLLAFSGEIAEEFKNKINLGEAYSYTLSAQDHSSYIESLKKEIVGKHDPKTVVLLDVEPEKQKLMMDFSAFEKLLGIKALGFGDIKRDGNKLYYLDGDTKINITKIYNRAIPEEFLSSGSDSVSCFKYSDDLDVEWSCHPSLELRYSKFALPYLQHPNVPPSFILSDMASFPENLNDWVLKPLFSFGGHGVKISPSQKDLDSINDEDKKNYLLMKKVDYAPFIPDPDGDFSKAEVRLMCFKEGSNITPVIMWGRLTKSAIVNADLNKTSKWTGGGPVFVKKNKTI